MASPKFGAPHAAASPGTFVEQASIDARRIDSDGGARPRLVGVLIYLVAFLTGAIVMSFEMLGSRYLNPYFGSGIYTWAALISTVLAALTAGYFAGGWIADRTASAAVLGATVAIGATYLLLLPTFAQSLLEFVLALVDDVRSGSLIAAMAIMFVPVTFLGMYSPFAIRLLLRSARRAGMVSGSVYGVSTAGAIAGTLGTTFFLIPTIGTRAITLALGAAGLAGGLALVALARVGRKQHRITGAVGLAAFVLIGLASATTQGEELIDRTIRADMLKRADGRIAHIETEYNDIFITKRRDALTMSFQLKGFDYTESVANLRDPDDLPVRYTQVMTVAAVYPAEAKTILMIGLGGGSLSTYLGRFMPETTIDTIEIDSGVIAAAKTYFGIKETSRVRYHGGDGRVYLNRNKQLYDLILVDAYHGGFVPFHLLTKEFYELVKQRLAPAGAAAFNVHDGSKLYASTVRTLAAVFANVDLYSTRQGEVIAVATAQAAPARDALARRGRALQERYGFRYPLPDLLARRMANPQWQAANGDIITDDFAPANLYDTMRDIPRRRP
jgi:spermidine synthase